jgi:pentatricopeptide repeat protein
MHAHALEKAGRIEEAYEVWHELVANNPEDGVAKQNLQRLEVALESG